MEVRTTFAELSRFWNDRGRGYSRGVQTEVHLGDVLAGLSSRLSLQCRRAPAGPTHFHMHERSVYPLMEKLLRSALPHPALIDTETTLKRLPHRFRPQCTDVSVRSMEDHFAGRLDDNRHVVFIEVKSVFFGEKLKDGDIMADLEKLLSCEAAYGAACLLVLVGLPTELQKHDSTSMLELVGEAAPKTITLPSGRRASLYPSARDMQGPIHTHVWAVSASPRVAAGGSYYRYLTFHKQNL